jgi:RNA polymerase sigma-70 factor (ECF subfamily)
MTHDGPIDLPPAGSLPPRALAPSSGTSRGVDEGWFAAGAWSAPPVRRRLVAFARRYVGDRAAAEDIAQEALLRAGTALPRLRSRERAEAWLFRICRHAAIDHVRSRRVRRRVWAALPEEFAEGLAAPAPVADEGPAPALPPGATARLLRDLPAHHRLLLGLHYEGGLSQGALCRLTGLSPSALRVRLFRARRALAGLLGPGHQERRAG